MKGDYSLDTDGVDDLVLSGELLSTGTHNVEFDLIWEISGNLKKSTRIGLTFGKTFKYWKCKTTNPDDLISKAYEYATKYAHKLRES